MSKKLLKIKKITAINTVDFTNPIVHYAHIRTRAYEPICSEPRYLYSMPLTGARTAAIHIIDMDMLDDKIAINQIFLQSLREPPSAKSDRCV